MALSRLAQSFQRLAAAVDRPRIAWGVVVAMLAVHTALLMYSAYVHSPTLNEPGHLVAGLSHWKFGRFELYRVNPPLVRMVAALPVMAVGYEEDWSGFYERPGARPVFGMGEDFVAANGPRSFFLFMIARWACIPFSWLGAVVCYLWARDLYGRSAGLLACGLWCFSPNILAHASLITADAHATALGLAACYTFWRWLKNPTWTQAALTGVVLGLAELAKTTLILFYPLWPLLWLVYRWKDRASMTARVWVREAGMLALRMAVGLYVVNLGYGFEGSLTPLREFHFVSDLFTGNAEENPQSAIRNPQSENPQSQNRFADTWLRRLPVPFPKNYLVGIDVQQRDFEHYGRPSYLRGEWRDHGWWYYYLYAALVKVPLGTWALGLLALFVTLRGRRNSLWRDELLLLLPAAVIFTVVSSKTGINEHFRYVLPAFPFLYVWIAQIYVWIVHNCLTCGRPSGYKGTAIGFRFSAFAPARAAVAAVMGCWLVGSSIWIYPHSLSYFNEAVGGPLNGPRHLLGSNVDWGQDLYYAHRLILDAELPTQTLRLICYCGAFSPADVGVEAIASLPELSASRAARNSSIPHFHADFAPEEQQAIFVPISTSYYYEWAHERAKTVPVQDSSRDRLGTYAMPLLNHCYSSLVYKSDP